MNREWIILFYTEFNRLLTPILAKVLKIKRTVQSVTANINANRRPERSNEETSMLIDVGTNAEVVGKIIYLRQNYHFGPHKIAMYLQRYHEHTISPSGVWRILKRLDLNRSGGLNHFTLPGNLHDPSGAGAARDNLGLRLAQGDELRRA